MNLHDNQSLFAAAVQFASRNKEDGGLRIKPLFIEKDYWICRSLKFLSDSEVEGKAVFKGGTSLSKAYGLEAFEINVLDPERTATEKIVSLLRYSLADDYISELRAKIRHFYDLHFLWHDETIRVFLQSDNFRTEFKTLIESDQARFNEPLGWQSKSFTESPLLTSFDGIWEQLKNTYIRELPDLAYQNIPSEQEIKQSFIELSSQLF